MCQFLFFVGVGLQEGPFSIQALLLALGVDAERCKALLTFVALFQCFSVDVPFQNAKIFKIPQTQIYLSTNRDGGFELSLPAS